MELLDKLDMNVNVVRKGSVLKNVNNGLLYIVKDIEPGFIAIIPEGSDTGMKEILPRNIGNEYIAVVDVWADSLYR
jgi:hypothetical protein